MQIFLNHLLNPVSSISDFLAKLYLTPALTCCKLCYTNRQCTVSERVLSEAGYLFIQEIFANSKGSNEQCTEEPVGLLATQLRFPSSPFGETALGGPGPPHYRGFTITLRHITLGWGPLDEWSARRRDLLMTTPNTPTVYSASVNGL